MKKVFEILKGIINLIVGFLSIPAAFLGFILMTNSSKGWNVQNDDGLLFIPLGILILLVSLSVLTFEIINPILRKKKGKMVSYLPLVFYLSGIVAYLLYWGIN